MDVARYRLQRIFFGLLLGTAGLYAGVLLMYSVGIAPALDAMPGPDLLHFWQLHDYYLHIRIRVLLAAVGILYVLTLAALLTALRTKTFALIAAAFLLFAADIQTARTLQRPVNRSIRMADQGEHSSSSVALMEQQLFHALHLRQLCAIGAFGLLSIAAMLPHSSPAQRQPELVA